MVPCRVQMLDGSDYEVDLERKATGLDLLEKVADKLNLIEKDYFGFTYVKNNTKFWIDNNKLIDKQIKKGPWIVLFELKYYPDPTTIQEEVTRYQIFLQVRRDLITGRLPSSFLTTAVLGSYAVQSELGDYSQETHGNGTDYIKTIQFSPSTNDELMEKIVELHRTHKGQSPSEAELYFLDNARNLALYGVHLHDATNSEGEPVQIGVCAAGLLLYRDKIRESRLSWPKIIKIRYKRNNFFIDVRPDEADNKPIVNKYKLANVKFAKRLWRIAVDHHAFFRLREPEFEKRTQFSRAPYRYSGRTQYQAQRAAQQAERGKQGVDRGPGTTFTASRSVDNLAQAYSTERWEKHTVDEFHTTTLDLRNQRSAESYGDIDTRSQFSQDRDGQISLLAGGYGAKYNRSVAGSQAGDEPRYGTAPVSPRYDPALQQQQQPRYAASQDGASVASYASRQSRPKQVPANGNGAVRRTPGPAGSVSGRVDRYQPEWTGGRPTSRADSYYSDASSMQNGGYGTQPSQRAPPRRNRISSRSSQSSREDSRGGAAVPAVVNAGYRDDEPGYATIQDVPELTGGNWQPRGPGSTPKTTTRTFTAPDGSIITEYRTEKNGVVETHIEKRTRVESVPEEEDFDYDRALADAIHAVTDMNPDLSVQKIEIHTRSQEV